MHVTIIPTSKTRWEAEQGSGSQHEGDLGSTLPRFPWFALISVSVWLLSKFAAIESCISHLTSWGRLKEVDAIGKLDEIRQIWEAIQKILGLMGFGKHLQNWTRHWPGCHGNQQCWEAEMSATVRKVLPKVLRDHINSPHTCGLEIGLLCYPANLQHGAENSSGVKSVLWLPLLCFEKKKKSICVLGSSYLLSTTEQEQREKDRASAKNGNVLSISTSCFIKLQLKKKNCFSQMVLMGCQLSKCVCWKTPFTKDPIVPRK